MQDDILEDFDKYVEKEFSKVGEQTASEVMKEIIKNVDKNLYNAYTPLEYIRTKNLKNSIIINRQNKNEYLVEFEPLTNIKFSVTGEDVSNYVAKWQNDGHTDNTGIDNMFHNYPSRNYIEETIKNINEKYGENVVEKVDNTY